MLAPLQGSCGEATKRLVLSSTNPPTLPWMVQESWTRCLVRGTLQDCLVLSFLISSLLGKTKPITFPPTKASHRHSTASIVPQPRATQATRLPAEPGHTPKHTVRRAIKALASRSLSCL